MIIPACINRHIAVIRFYHRNTSLLVILISVLFNAPWPVTTRTGAMVCFLVKRAIWTGRIGSNLTPTVNAHSVSIFRINVDNTGIPIHGLITVMNDSIYADFTFKVSVRWKTCYIRRYRFLNKFQNEYNYAALRYHISKVNLWRA